MRKTLITFALCILLLPHVGTAGFRDALTVDLGFTGRYLNGTVESTDPDFHLTSDRYSHLVVEETSGGPGISAAVGDDFGYGLGSRGMGGFVATIGAPLFSGFRFTLGGSVYLTRSGYQKLTWEADTSSAYSDQYGSLTYESSFQYFGLALALEYHPGWSGVYFTAGRELGTVNLTQTWTWERFDSNGLLYRTPTKQ